MVLLKIIFACFHSVQNLVLWCRRIRYRRGYGIHSPSDFFLVTSVVYEKLPYYAYAELESRDFEFFRPHYNRKTNRLLFRLVNYFHPSTLLEVGTGNGMSLAYMQAARASMQTAGVDAEEKRELLERLGGELKAMEKVDFVHIGFTLHFKEAFEEIYPYLHSGSCMLVSFLYESEEKQKWWNELLADERVRIAFDLYDIGIILFEEKRFKQNYIVNFV